MIQLDMTPDMKRWVFEAHDFYVAQINQRVVAQFQDMKGDADRYAEAEHKRLGSRPGWSEDDMASIAERAHDNAVEFYRLLAALRQSVILGALAGLYHQWEKQLRDFIAMELLYSLGKEKAEKTAWSRDIGKMFDLLNELGWNVRAQSFFPSIDACRLIVDVYKNGQGPSLIELNKNIRFICLIHLPI